MTEQEGPSNFIQNIIEDDIRNGKHDRRVHTRFPPEPNGYLHIGHAKSICLNFGLAEQFGGQCNLRFDDTNPSKEDVEYVESIMEDVHWLGFDWENRLFYASDYFPQLYEFAEQLIKLGRAYVCDLSAEEIKAYRGTLTKPGRESPFRNRTVEENLDLFRRMRAGEFPDGSRVLRAKIDMASQNLNMRDPVLYRILRAPHHRTGDTWCIYPMYDYAHPLSDYLEGVTHSICTLEFEDHRPLYDWVLETLGFTDRPQQIEFARLNLTRTLMSKRHLRTLVEQGVVSDWDDPRMPTICGLRRRGYTPEAIRDFCHRIGVAKSNSVVDVAMLEHCVREDLNKRVPRVMAVLRPLRVIIDNYPADMTEEFTLENNPEDPAAGVRQVTFSRELFIERDDFNENPAPKFYRLAPGREVRLKNAYIIKCQFVEKSADGNIIAVHCTYDPESKHGGAAEHRRVKSTLHWLSARHTIPAEVRLYDYLLLDEEVGDDGPRINPNSLQRLTDCLVEESLAAAVPGNRYQFLRQGYFCVDPDSRAGHLVFNLIVGLRDTRKK